ncbi:inhibitor of nuclear factor kappa-B kinase subunit beta [Musca domestica]|uniref:IkappaB kinase n=1 Tax=Musca domestica TaxID=7370 RepID=A0A9J7CLG7_MUSDO|nr:inhibitor of nuclear factor kappa-B kinase subunit beta [Musca domestica]
MQALGSYNDWELVRALGAGGFGEVHLWRHRITNQEVATKHLKFNNNLRSDEIGIIRNRWIQEYNWMQMLQTPYIVGAIELQDNGFLQYLQSYHHMRVLPVIVMEYCNGGDLRARLSDIKHLNGLHEKEIRDILLALRHAVAYLHDECNIEHRDIKPENIVIHRTDNQRIYKLTDFGYAREIPDATIAQSVVGTRHYVAPEVIEPGNYTKTVDYWSVGVLTFELMCGLRPFIPHREFKVILTQILEKPANCIAITQDVTNEDKFQFKDELFAENHCSPIFKAIMERWLKMALDGNYKTRGHQDGQLRFYTLLDCILSSKIITVFSLSSYEFYYFDARTFSNNSDFFDQLSVATGIAKEHTFFTLPTSHPKRSLCHIAAPIDFYVDDWSDTGNPENPRAMLYVTDVAKGQCDYNAHRDKMNSSTTSRAIFEYLSIDRQKFDELPTWLLEQFERYVHYLLQNEQRYLEAYVRGLYEFIISVEDEEFRIEENIQRIHEKRLLLSGRIDQFAYTAKVWASLQKSQNHVEEAQALWEKCDIVKNQVITKIMRYHKSILQHCKALANEEILKKLPNEDIYQLKSFRQFVSSDATKSQRMYECIASVDRWALQMSNFPSSKLASIHNEIMGHCNMHVKIVSELIQTEQYLNKLEKELQCATEKMLSPLQDEEIVSEMGAMCIDGNSSLTASTSAPMSHSSMVDLSLLLNGHCQENGEEVTSLIERVNILTELMNALTPNVQK